MDLTSLEGYADAVAAIRANTSPRAQYLHTLESYVDGTQYVGRPDWFTGDAPLWERAPCIVYPIVRTAIDSNVDLVLGEGRFPSITSRPDEDDTDFDEELGLDEKVSKTLDRFIVEVSRKVCFASCMREVFGSAQGCGSGVLLVGVRGGNLFLDTTRAKWCTPTFAADGSLAQLVIEYPYLDQFQGTDGKWRVRARIYRRLIDTEKDITYLPADANVSGLQPNWVADPAQTFAHGFGFCPAHWYPFMRGCSVVNDFDGRAIHAHLLDELRALDFILSQRHRAALYAGDPQWTEAGVELGSSPTDTGRVMGMPGTAAGGAAGTVNPVTTRYVDQTVRKGRKKSPGTVWQYEDKDVRVQLHTLPGDALKAIDEHAADLRRKIAESLAVVFTDAESMQIRELSGRALEALKARQLDRCDQYRSDVEDHLVLPSLNMLLRVIHVTARRGGVLRLAGMKKALPILESFDVADVAAA